MSNVIFAVDPGTTESAFVVFDGERVIERGKLPNEILVRRLRNNASASRLVVEMIASYGMAVGAEVFQTCVWIGRYLEAWGQSHALLYRRDVKLHLCGSARAKDGNIRQALIDRWGGKEKAIGKKATPGPLYGVSADVWAALAVAVTYSDLNANTSHSNPGAWIAVEVAS